MFKTRENNNIGTCHGFTYVEVLVAFMIFGLMLVFVMRLGTSIFDLSRASQLENRMIHLARLEFENYKTGINDLDAFLEATGFTFENSDGNGNVLIDDQVSQDFSVTIEENFISNNISSVTVTVSSEDERVSDAVVTAQIIKDSE